MKEDNNLSLEGFEDFGILPTPPQNRANAHENYVNQSIGQPEHNSSPFQKELDLSDADEL